jgi:hypothetical protein
LRSKGKIFIKRQSWRKLSVLAPVLIVAYKDAKPLGEGKTFAKLKARRQLYEQTNKRVYIKSQKY